MLSLITGGSRGIGKAIAIELAKKGSDLILVSKQEPTLKKTANELIANTNRTISTYACDLSLESEVEGLAQYCLKASLVPEFLVLDAGIFIEGSLIKSDPEDFRHTMDVNLNSIYHLVRLLAPHMASFTAPRIVIIASTAAYEPYPVGALYGVSKWALRGYAINLRKELMQQNIGVTLVSPGGTLTDLWKGEELPPKRLLEPRDIGIAVASLMDLSSQAVVEEIIIRPILGDMHD